MAYRVEKEEKKGVHMIWVEIMSNADNGGCVTSILVDRERCQNSVQCLRTKKERRSSKEVWIL